MSVGIAATTMKPTTTNKLKMLQKPAVYESEKPHAAATKLASDAIGMIHRQNRCPVGAAMMADTTLITRSRTVCTNSASGALLFDPPAVTVIQPATSDAPITTTTNRTANRRPRGAR